MATKQKQGTQEKKDVPAIPSENEIQKFSAEGIIKNDGELMDLDDIAGNLQESSYGLEMTMQYYDFPQGEERRILYLDDTTLKSRTGNDIPAVMFFVAEEKMFGINASAVLVSTLQPAGKQKKFSVLKTGEQKSNDGLPYFTYQITELI